MTQSTYLELSQAPVMKTQILIRRPLHEVFEAFVDPAITTKFWFTKSSGRLEQGAKVVWTWEMYNVSTTVRVKEVKQNRTLLIEWNDDRPTTVEWSFTPYQDDATFVEITETGFKGTGDQVSGQALDSMGGFSFLLAGAKAFLEHGVMLNLTDDHAPPKR